MYFYILTILMIIVFARLFFLKPQVRLFIDGFDAVLELNLVFRHKFILFKHIIRLTFFDRILTIYLLGKKTDSGPIRPKKKNGKTTTPIKKVLDCIKIIKPELKIKLGLGSADKTAVTAGALMAYFAVLNLKYQSDKEKEAFVISPDFGELCFRAEGKCIIKLKVAHIIYVLLFKRRNNNGKTSDRKHYDHDTGKPSKHG